MEHPCEPYVIAPSEAMPRYDERFRGMNSDRLGHAAAMRAVGFHWRLLPEHFLVHLPHGRALQDERGRRPGQPPPGPRTPGVHAHVYEVLIMAVQHDAVASY